MGVPITFLDKYNPEQFEIIWLDVTDTTRWYGSGLLLNEKKRSIADYSFVRRQMDDG